MTRHFSVAHVGEGLQIFIRPSRRGRRFADVILATFFVSTLGVGLAMGTGPATAVFGAVGLIPLVLLAAGFKVEHLVIDHRTCTAHRKLGPVTWKRSVSIEQLGCFADLRHGDAGYLLGSHLRNGRVFRVATSMGLSDVELDELAALLNEHLAELRGADSF